jgi:hypothetical protein
VPLITESDEYKEGGALFIIWDEAEGGKFSDGPIGMFYGIGCPVKCAA